MLATWQRLEEWDGSCGVYVKYIFFDYNIYIYIQCIYMCIYIYIYTVCVYIYTQCVYIYI